ncbi:MAG: tripartite tricarboxylate transporter substrate binding protein, partial [Rhizobiales bacterium]|nr:tripartite tricarboxylate transporter substrate binding protein [Hyphomicrobiales bacterium]
MTIARTLLLCLLTMLPPASGALAQAAYPSQMVKIVVPFTAGSNTDILARSLADKLGAMWKQNVIVENRPGIPGTVSVANSTPDGYTLMLTSNGHTILNIINKDLPVDPVKSFAGITPVATVPLVLIVTPSVEAKNLNEFIALAKAKPNALNFS